VSDRVTTVDLFCGAGGLSLGLQSAGADCHLAVDLDPNAVATYRKNLGDDVQAADVNSMSFIPECDIITGGPPCQGFSSAGARRHGDDRNSLVGTYARMIAARLPLAFMFENVEGFLTAEDGKRVIELLDPLIAAGYRIHLRKVNLAAFGVPQLRKRVIGIGGLGWDPVFPEPTHQPFGAPGATKFGSLSLPLTPTLQEALQGLPAASITGPTTPSDHLYRPLEGDDLQRARALRPGMTMRDLPEELWHPSYRRRAYRRVMDGTPTERRGGAPAGLRRLRWEEPSKAITGAATTEFIHPSEDRPLTVREAARIQTFPDTFDFCGPTRQKIQLIGNAIPPRFAEAIGRALFQQLPARKPKVTKGALLSFVPTPANAMSPALQHTTDAIAGRYMNAGETRR
jgi:DNA (cytosine-5)-methyltransferase 1